MGLAPRPRHRGDPARPRLLPVRAARPSPRAGGPPRLRAPPLALRELVLVVIAFLALPAAIYFLSYVPWMLQHHSAKEVVTVQRDIWNYHAHLNATHPYFSRWWTWPWLYRPTWYFFRYEEGWT